MLRNSITIGSIENYYGKLHITKFDGKSYWAIGDYDETTWEEIPESLYDELANFNATTGKVDCECACTDTEYQTLAMV